MEAISNQQQQSTAIIFGTTTKIPRDIEKEDEDDGGLCSENKLNLYEDSEELETSKSSDYHDRKEENFDNNVEQHDGVEKKIDEKVFCANSNDNDERRKADIQIKSKSIVNDNNVNEEANRQLNLDDKPTVSSCLEINDVSDECHQTSNEVVNSIVDCETIQENEMHLENRRRKPVEETSSESTDVNRIDRIDYSGSVIDSDVKNSDSLSKESSGKECIQAEEAEEEEVQSVDNNKVDEEEEANTTLAIETTQEEQPQKNAIENEEDKGEDEEMHKSNSSAPCTSSVDDNIVVESSTRFTETPHPDETIATLLAMPAGTPQPLDEPTEKSENVEGEKSRLEDAEDQNTESKSNLLIDLFSSSSSSSPPPSLEAKSPKNENNVEIFDSSSQQQHHQEENDHEQAQADEGQENEKAEEEDKIEGGDNSKCGDSEEIRRNEDNLDEDQNHSLDDTIKHQESSITTPPPPPYLSSSPLLKTIDTTIPTASVSDVVNAENMMDTSTDENPEVNGDVSFNSNSESLCNLINGEINDRLGSNSHESEEQQPQQQQQENFNVNSSREDLMAVIKANSKHFSDDQSNNLIENSSADSCATDADADDNDDRCLHQNVLRTTVKNENDELKVSLTPKDNGHNGRYSAINNNCNYSERINHHHSNNMNDTIKKVSEWSVGTNSNNIGTHNNQIMDAEPAVEYINDKATRSPSVDLPKSNELDRRLSHDSTFSTSSSSSSMAESGSSRQLVIDYPINDAKVVPPLRITLKRKNSENNSFDYELQQDDTIASKKPCLERKWSANQDRNLMTTTPTAGLDKKEISSKDYIAKSPLRSDHLNPSTTENEVAFVGCVSQRSKYICFNCNKVFFETLIALREHQVTCLKDDRHMYSDEHFRDSPVDDITSTALTTPAIETRTVNVLKATETSSNVDEMVSSSNAKPISDSGEATQRPLTFYKCCGQHYDKWTIFLHMRQQHQRFACLYCIRSFSSVEKLSLHLENKHDLEQIHYNSEDAFRQRTTRVSCRRQSLNPSFTSSSSATDVNEPQEVLEATLLMCCTCEHVFLERTTFAEHTCTEYMKPCGLCGQKGRHSNNCKLHPDARRKGKRKPKEKQKSETPATNAATLHSGITVAPASDGNAYIPTSLPSPRTTVHENNSVTDPLISPFALPIELSTNLLREQQQQELQQQKQQQPQPQQYNEDSNSSSNMVIDESCNTNTITTTAADVQQTFRTSNEQWQARLMNDVSQNNAEIVRPTDKSETPPVKGEKLALPKFTIRVPKEFQKSLDAPSSSSSESGDGVDYENADETTELNVTGDSNISRGEGINANDTELNCEQSQSSPVGSLGVEEEDISSNSCSMRIAQLQQQIEQTRAEIEMNRKVGRPTKLGKKLKIDGTEENVQGTWSPTPPASPAITTNDMFIQRDENTDSATLSTDALNKEFIAETASKITETDTAATVSGEMPEAPTGLVRDSPAVTHFHDDDMDIDDTISSSAQTVYSSKEHNQEEHQISENLFSGETETSQNSNDERTATAILKDEVPVQTPIDTQPITFDDPENKMDPDNKMEIAKNDEENSSSNKTESFMPTFSSIDSGIEAGETALQPTSAATSVPVVVDDEKAKPEPPSDGIELANEDTLVIDLDLSKPLDKFEMVEFIRVCIKAAFPFCLYCNHARRIAVNGHSLVLHMLAQHRFSAKVDSITAEELQPATIIAKLKSFLPALESEYFNLSSYCTIGDGTLNEPYNERIFECFLCRFIAATHKELYLHNRKMHSRPAILCFMCRANFYSFSEILCHICPGAAHKVSIFDVKFRCCLCDLDKIPSPFRLMVHLRKKHYACDICLEDCRDQSRLSSHVWKHKLHHLCYRCSIAYRSKADISKHLFWKHGTESVICKKCLQKRWPHVYHFCIPPSTFTCDVCQMNFAKAMYLTVHKRLHTGDFRYACTEDDCTEKFISRALLLKHAATHQSEAAAIAETEEQQANVPKSPNDEVRSADDVEKSEISPEEKPHPQDDASSDKPKEELEKSESVGSEDLTKVNESEENKDENSKLSECLSPKEEEKSEEKPNIDNKHDDGETKMDVDTITPCEETEKESKDKTLPVDSVELKTENAASSTDKPRKKKKHKRSKLTLDDLNLIAPNLSESDSSSDSDSDAKSTKSVVDVKESARKPSADDIDSIEATKPEVTAASADKEKEEEEEIDKNDAGQVLQIWKNILEAQQQQQQQQQTQQTNVEEVATTANEVERKLTADYDEDNYPTPARLHVVYSDHDYCSMFRPSTPAEKAKRSSLKKCKEKRNSTSVSLSKSRSKGDNSFSSSSDDENESSDSSSSSCCSVSNCSCSSNSSGSSSSSSSDDSDTSNSSNASESKPHRRHKKSERSGRHKKSESLSPVKRQKHESECVNVTDPDPEDGNALLHSSNQQTTDTQGEAPGRVDDDTVVAPKEPALNESDLETAESDTDEEFYDEHPQKQASEKLTLKRAQLMSQKALSPSHNYDIVENSRPSTPSLPGDVHYEKRAKKKKKRDRKSTNKSGVSPPKFKKPNGKHDLNMSNENAITLNTPNAATYPTEIAQVGMSNAHGIMTPESAYMQPTIMQPYQYIVDSASMIGHQQHMLSKVGMHNVSTPLMSRVSEGGSGSDADSALKRSKRARRPNKFYGYTSDDETMGANSSFTQGSLLGMRAFKPQPPQLTWDKEDLPAPSRSSSNNKPSKLKRLRAELSGTLKRSRKRSLFADNDSFGASARKRSAKKKNPPITLKLKTSYISSLLSDSQQNAHDKADSDNDDQMSTTSEEDKELTAKLQQLRPQRPQPTLLNQSLTNEIILPTTLPPTPQTKAFNQRIPPALLPNPTVEILQYFKANNIRYPIRPPAGARQAREGESVYCYCRCPYDEVSEMIACDGQNCLIEWFHFECVGIIMAPQGKWFCAECRPHYSEQLYATSTAASSISTVAAATTATAPLRTIPNNASAMNNANETNYLTGQIHSNSSNAAIGYGV